MTAQDTHNPSKSSALSLGQRLLRLWPYFRGHKGNMVGFVTAMRMLVTSSRQLAGLAVPIKRGLAALERGMELIDNTPAQQGGTDARLHALSMGEALSS